MCMSNPALDEWFRAAERRERRWSSLKSLSLIVGCILICAIGAYISLNRVEVGDDRALGAIRAAGFRDPRLGGAVTAACADSESSRRFTATNPLGRVVQGTVCCGLTSLDKGCTIRWGR
jgi:hypothetical protein